MLQTKDLGLKVDLHIHSTNSDGRNSVSIMVAFGYSVHQLDGIGFAEHVTQDHLAPLKSYEEASDYAKKELPTPFHVFPVAELSVWVPYGKGNKERKVHTVVLGEIEELEKMLRTVNFKDQLRLSDLDEFNLAKILAHPTPPFLTPGSLHLNQFDSIEYSPSMLSTSRGKRYSLLDLFANGFSVVSSSDAHSLGALGKYTQFGSVPQDLRYLIDKENISAVGINGGGYHRGISKMKRSLRDQTGINISFV
jgi:hypothetical protein